MRTILLLFTLAIIGSSCRTVPYYTTVKKMTQIRTGMKLDAVNSTLGISPHDYYLDVNNGKKIMVYKYKHRYHKVLKMEVSKERGLAGGSPRFRKANNAYFVFDQNSGKLDGFITDLGRKQGEEILKDENYLRLFLDDPEKMRGLTSKSSKKSSPSSGGKGGFFKKFLK
ncbi:MAG TPA: hypothetical protein EYN71_01115 [Flavobacteriales bacterium]|nr:hypothetical protein [Flavobacteriales bacterium]HIO68306.1 hypothetical protein [Flavobacteriales bacterium]